ncbi:type II restriction endonuclease [Luteimonas mephitis]|uniref:type II restriction endonuclease n=1 Tax=Luteimonas mephitis TaxID=83615 RepID=UPI00040EB7D6|nr:type II restriction endonuclease [Luteimonas mephitis]
MSEDFRSWLDAHAGDEWHWYIKRLAANDTNATGAHQAGPYLPKQQAFDLFPSLRAQTPNPKVVFAASVDSHGLPERDVTVTWYNQRSRNECRITRWGGQVSPVVHPDSTGAAVVLAFRKQSGTDSDYCAVWVCREAEVEVLEERVGPVEPGLPLLVSGQLPLFRAPTQTSCTLTAATMPADWLTRFPAGQEIAEYCAQLRRAPGKPVDDRLLIRRACEYEMFLSIEKIHVLPRLQQGFASVDEFINYSSSVNNRRKSRSGRSLELHLNALFREEGISFSHGEVSEGNKKPDFLFPSASAYRRGEKPLWMLAAKTTCKDRWRQILNEANLIPNKHLITLQEGVSTNQFREMRDEGVTLVAPARLHRAYPAAIRPDLMTLETFVQTVRR